MDTDTHTHIHYTLHSSPRVNEHLLVLTSLQLKMPHFKLLAVTVCCCALQLPTQTVRAHACLHTHTPTHTLILICAFQQTCPCAAYKSVGPLKLLTLSTFKGAIEKTSSWLCCTFLFPLKAKLCSEKHQRSNEKSEKAKV